MQTAIATRPKAGEIVCGDAAQFWTDGRRTTIAVVDGLGHGLNAEKAALAAVDYVASHLEQPMAELFSGCSKAIRYTRGVAMGIASIDEQEGVLSYAGIGNTRAMVHGRKTTRLSGNYGIVGGTYKRLTIERVLLSPGDLVIMYTDGLKEVIDVSHYNAVPGGDLSELARRVMEEWSLERDDAAILVYRKEQFPWPAAC
jgi:serine phosphatase RsbU (regulator of sigma subunit)